MLLRVAAQPVLCLPPDLFFCPASSLLHSPTEAELQGRVVSDCFFPGLQVDQLKCKVTSLEEECSLLQKQMSVPPQREPEERGHPDAMTELWAENQRLTASLQELQGMLQVSGRTGQAPGHFLSPALVMWVLEGWGKSPSQVGLSFPLSILLGCGGCHCFWVWVVMGY